MRLFIDTTSLLGEETGIGRYARQIALAAARSSMFETHFSPCNPTQAKTDSPGLLVRCKKVLATHPTLYQTAKNVFNACRYMASWKHGPQYDCYFEPNFILRSSVRSRTAVVTAHDLSCFRYPEWHPAERVRHMERHFQRSLARATRIITVSEAVRQELLAKYGLAEGRVVTIPNGVDHAVFHPMSVEQCALVRQMYHLPEHFVLHVGTLEPRKNQYNLLLSHTTLPEPLRKKYPLLLAGAVGWGNAALYDTIKSTPHVHWLGYVPDAELAALYTMADVMVYPSWYEGFGLPVAEAMACGCPVLTSTDPALVETSGGAARHVPPHLVDTIRAVLKELLEDVDQRRAMRQLGMQRAAVFSWEASMKRHLQLFWELCLNL